MVPLSSPLMKQALENPTWDQSTWQVITNTSLLVYMYTLFWYRSQQAFICNHDYHWLTVRKLGHQVCVVVWHGGIYFTSTSFQPSIWVMPNVHVYNSPLSFSPPFTISAPLSSPLSSLPHSLLFFHIRLSCFSLPSLSPPSLLPPSYLSLSLSSLTPPPPPSCSFLH